MNRFYELIKNDIIICKCGKIMTLREWYNHNDNSDHGTATPIDSIMGKAILKLKSRELNQS